MFRRFKGLAAEYRYSEERILPLSLDPSEPGRCYCLLDFEEYLEMAALQEQADEGLVFHFDATLDQLTEELIEMVTDSDGIPDREIDLAAWVRALEKAAGRIRSVANRSEHHA